MRLLLIFLLFSSVGFADELDSLLAVSKARAGTNGDELFAVLDTHRTEFKTTPAEIADLKFLLAYMPLGDLAMMNPQALLENVRLARKTREEFPWGKQVSDELYRHWVLPQRVSQEPFVWGWRDVCYALLKDRVKNLSMTDAALEVNHWCHEVATYQPDDSRDQDPLTTIRAGLGRCEEEMILAICALRSVGIPARQCFTPFWPHTDDNHAWVEVWSDGKWHYFGACEPEPVLDKGWFTSAAARTMLVCSQAYGDYRGSEPVLRRYGRSTLINSTAVYGPTHEVEVRLVDAKHKAVPKTKVIFNLWNYASLQPAAALETDQDGVIKLTCGKGTWILTAAKGDQTALKVVPADSDRVTLTLDNPKKMRELTAINYVPPPERQTSEGVAQDSLFKCRLVSEDSVREKTWSVWTMEVQTDSTDTLQLKPDSAWVYHAAQGRGLDGKKVLEMFRKARGNWGQLFQFLTGKYPHVLDKPKVNGESKTRFLLLEQFTDKDYRDLNGQTLEEHYEFSTLLGSVQRTMELLKVAKMDSSARERFDQYVIAPRIDLEPTLPWRQALIRFCDGYRELTSSANDEEMLKWVRQNIEIDTLADRLGPPLSPALTLKIRRGTLRDVEVLYAGLCRVRTIPARFNPVSNRLERWDGKDWTLVEIKPAEKGKEQRTEKGKLTVEAEADTTMQTAPYNKDWAVANWATDHFSDVDFGYQEPYNKITWPQELPTGSYCLFFGKRAKNGSANASVQWFDVRAGKEEKLKMRNQK